MTSPAPAGERAPLAILALVGNAFVWGTSWWPLRHLQGSGLHPLWTTAIAFTLASLVIVAFRPRAPRLLLRAPALWLLVVAAGATNAAFNWAIVIGDVVRVVLLFYLMPLWTVLLARIFLGERLGARSALRIALGTAGAAIVLWPAGTAVAGDWASHLPLPRTLADWLGVAGGFSFAFNNVMLRREARQPEEARALAMFAGGALVAAALATALTALGSIARPPPLALPWLGLVVALSFVFLAGNLALQYGAARLPANRTAVVMLTEVLFAAASAVVLGGGTMTVRLAIGGACVVAGALLAAVEPVRTRIRSQ